MRKKIAVFMIFLILLVIGACAQSPDDSNNTSDKTTVSTAEKPADYIIDADFKAGNGFSSYNRVYQIDEWIYFSESATLNRINVNGNHYEKLFTADSSQESDDEVNSLTQCGQYLVFAYGNYIYKMDLATLETEVLVDGTKENAFFTFTIKGDDIYFTGTEGAFVDGIYKIAVDGTEPEKVLSSGKEEYIWSIQISNDRIYYGIFAKGVFSVHLDGSDKKQILNVKHIKWQAFTVTDKYIYFLNTKYSLQRSDLEGKNIINLVDSCSVFNIIDDNIIYTERISKDDGYFMSNIYKIPINQGESAIIHEGEIRTIAGSCGNWVYFMESNKTAMFRVRLDGTGEMQVSK